MIALLGGVLFAASVVATGGLWLGLYAPERLVSMWGGRWDEEVPLSMALLLGAVVVFSLGFISAFVLFFGMRWDSGL